MDRQRLGRTSIDVPAIGMGTWRTFDTDEDRRPLVHVAIKAGINLFDSSPMYGRAEAALARALEGIRDRVVVATKIWTANSEEGRAQADHALGLFDWVDIYQVHNLVNVPAQLALLESLKSEGKVRAVGATHYQESAFRDLAALLKSKRLDTVQIPYNPLRRAAERELLPLAESTGLGVLVMSPLQHADRHFPRQPDRADRARVPDSRDADELARKVLLGRAVIEAWHDSRLPEESLRTYINRARKKLKELGAEAGVVNKSRKGTR